MLSVSAAISSRETLRPTCLPPICFKIHPMVPCPIQDRVAVLHPMFGASSVGLEDPALKTTSGLGAQAPHLIFFESCWHRCGGHEWRGPPYRRFPLAQLSPAPLMRYVAAFPFLPYRDPARSLIPHHHQIPCLLLARDEFAGAELLWLRQARSAPTGFVGVDRTPGKMGAGVGTAVAPGMRDELVVDPLFVYTVSINGPLMCVFLGDWFDVALTAL